MSRYLRCLVLTAFALLVAASTFTPAGATEPWSSDFAPAPTGLGMNNVVRALTVYDNSLIAGGQFTEAGGTACAYTARLDGNAWQSLGAGPGFEVWALLSDNGLLYAGGDAYSGTAVKYWDGATWHSVGATGGTWVRSLIRYNGQIVAGTEYGPSVIRYENGIWQYMGNINGSVRQLVEVNGDLIALGAFTQADGVPAQGVARWNGTGWEPFYTGSNTDFNGPVYGGTVLGNSYVIGGLFDTHFFEDLGYRMAWRHDGGWDPFPVEFPHNAAGALYVLTVYNGHLIAGGSFSGYPVTGMAELGPSGWVNSGFPLSGLISIVNAMQEWNGTLYVGGNFSKVDGIPSAYIGAYTEAPATTGIGGDTVGRPFVVSAAYPNPFHARTTIDLSLTQSGPARLTVFALNGQRVRTLDLGLFQAGPHSVSWDGKDDRGQGAVPGVYFMRVQVGAVKQAQKVVVY